MSRYASGNPPPRKVESQIRKSFLTTIAGAALIAGGGLAAAQQMESLPGRTTGATQGSSQRQQDTAQKPSERQSGAMQSPAQGRPGAIEEKERRSGQSGAMQSPVQGRPGAIEEKERRSGQSGAIPGPAQGRSGAVEEKGHRSSQSGAMQSPAQGRAASEQNKGGVTEQRSATSVNLSSDQRTRLHQTIIGADVRRVDHVDFSLSIGTRIPGTLRVYEVPESIVLIVPQYRGFEYIVVGDDLLIIDPRTLEIIAVLPV